MKYRTVGLSADLFKEMGAAVTILPGGEIVPAMDRGLLDAAEFNNPSSDILLGFPDVSKFFMMGSHHQQAECFEIIFNKAKFDALAPELKAILRNAAHAASADQLYTAYDRYSKDLEAIKSEGRQRHQDRRQGARRAARRLGEGDRGRSRRSRSSRRSSTRRRRGSSGPASICNTNNLDSNALGAAYKYFFG